MQLLANLSLAGLLVLITCSVQFAGLVGLSWVLRRRFMRQPDELVGVVSQGLSILFIVLGLFLLHAVQIWIYAVAFLLLGQLGSVEAALYFSASTFTTVGYGDVLLNPDWRMLAAAESANGFLLLGWSTAFLVSVTSRVRLFEAEVERLSDGD
jgi:ion channel